METAPPELVAQLRELADPDGWPASLAALVGRRGLANSSQIPSSASASPRAARRCRWPCSPRRTAGAALARRACAYLRLSEAYEDEAARADGLGWPVTGWRATIWPCLPTPLR
jgi:hypothetical protein